MADVLRVARARKIFRGNMSERIYAWLLRLYPAEFRKAYGDQAMQLFRDRAREERGFRRIVFWMDIAATLRVRCRGSMVARRCCSPKASPPSAPWTTLRRVRVPCC